MTGNKDPATRTDYARGEQRAKYPLNPALQGRVCRQMAADMRAEAAMGWPDIPLNYPGGKVTISRVDAAASMDEQAARWEVEARGGPRNVEDRAKIGF